jgi:hypothetical protein
LILIFFGSPGVWIQVLVLARQVLYLLSHSPSPLVLVFWATSRRFSIMAISTIYILTYSARIPFSLQGALVLNVTVGWIFRPVEYKGDWTQGPFEFH